MSSPAAAATTTDPGEGLASQHKLKLKPPSYDGDYSTFEDWHYKFKAYMGVQHNFYSLFLPRAAQSTTRLTEAELRESSRYNTGTRGMGPTGQQLKVRADHHNSRRSSLHCADSFQHEIGLEIYRQLLLRFKTPIGTRSIGYLTKLLEPTFDTNNFEESFSNWE